MACTNLDNQKILTELTSKLIVMFVLVFAVLSACTFNPSIVAYLEWLIYLT